MSLLRSKASSREVRESLDSIRTLKQEISQFVVTEDSAQMYPGIERNEYDFTNERHNPFSTNLLEATSYLVKGCLGAGILSMHEAFMYGGIIASSIGAFAIAFFIAVGMHMLVKSAQKMYVAIRVSRLSYPDLAEAAVATGPLKCLRKFSKAIRYTIECFFFLEMSGTCSIYEIMIAKTIKRALEYLFTPINELQLPLRAYIFIIMIPLLLLCLIRKWKYLAPFSIVADLFLAVCIITTMIYSISESEGIHNRALWKSVPGLFRFFGICLYCMDGIPIVLPVENNMRSPQHVGFVINCGMILVSIAASLTGFFGYLGWGESCRSPVTIHMPLETIPIILQFLLSAMLTVTFAIQFWVPFKIIWRYIGKAHDLTQRYSRKRNRWEWFYRIVLLLFITCLSSVFPQPHNLMIFIGDFFVSFNSLIFPALIETLVRWRRHRPGEIRWSFIKDLFIIILGLVLCVGGLYSLYST